MAGKDAGSEANAGQDNFGEGRSRTPGFALIVLDASAVVELLTNGSLADPIRDALAERSDSFVVPHLLDIEVTSALRRLALESRVDSHRIGQALAGLAMLPAQRYAHTPFLDRIWELRRNFTCYDAAYIALAEATDATIYTCDRKLSKGHRARVRVFCEESA